MVACMSILLSGFIIFLLATSNPFTMGMPPYPTHGLDLNPLLQDPAFVFHPPILYAGYVGFAVPFVAALSMLLLGNDGRSHILWLRPWVLLAWFFLTIGIVIGSWWSYRQLGWGGWWFWDPAENASLMPWLAATALIHLLHAYKVKGVLYGGVIFLCLLVFLLSFFGTFLIRSGVMVSVHAFANDPLRGQYLLIFLAILLFLSCLLYCFKISSFPSNKIISLCSKESALYLQALLLLCLLLVVSLGTLYPVILQVLGLAKISVGYPYFNAVCIPLLSLVLLGMIWASDAKWHHDKWRRLLYGRRWLIFLFLLIPLLLANGNDFWPSICLVLAMGVFVQSFSDGLGRLRLQWTYPRFFRESAMLLAHVGVAVSVLAGSLLVMNQQQIDVPMRVGGSASVASYHFYFINTQYINHHNYFSIKGKMKVVTNNHEYMMYPQMRYYRSSKQLNPKPAIKDIWLSDVYVSMAQDLGNQQWLVRIYVKPFIRFIWLGGIMMALGALIAFFISLIRGGYVK